MIGWFGDRYWSKFNTVLSFIPYLTSSFTFKFLGSHYFPAFWCFYDDTYSSKILRDTIPSPTLPQGQGHRLWLFTWKFYVKVIKISSFNGFCLCLVWWYCSKIIFSTIPIPLLNVTVKVTDLTFMFQVFVKFLGPYCFTFFWWILFIFCMVINIGPTFYVVPSPPNYMTSSSRSQT